MAWTVWRWVVDAKPAPFYAPFLKFAGNCDRKQHYEVRYPSNAIIKAIFVPARTGGEGKPLHEDYVLMEWLALAASAGRNENRLDDRVGG
ncbi:hypothetical protein ACFSOZ_29700 [Mesorhizobium newzealandense]|uniref:Uncharacterized protein n=1 Tax=Mesorhizobium newzealandense TaxID=1300302 RepID=A0ABW4UKL6_9HYPH